MNEPQCLPREALKQYLAGWSDPEQSDLIESHLAECGACEQTIVALEADPDTLVEYLAHKIMHRTRPATPWFKTPWRIHETWSGIRRSKTARRMTAWNLGRFELRVNLAFTCLSDRWAKEGWDPFTSPNTASWAKSLRSRFCPPEDFGIRFLRLVFSGKSERQVSRSTLQMYKRLTLVKSTALITW